MPNHPGASRNSVKQQSRRWLLTVIASMLVLGNGRAQQPEHEAYPSRPVRLVAPVPPGGPGDLVARALAERLRAELGQPVIVDNRAGAAGTLGAAQVHQAPADGYTLLLSLPSAQITGPLMMKKPPFDGAKDFTPIGQFARAPVVLLVNRTVPVRNVQELVAYVRQRPGRLNYGSTGVGGNPHLMTELLKMRTGMHIVHIPYKGGGLMLQALLSNEVQVLFGELGGALPWIQSGQLIPLAIVSDKRSPLLADVPTLMEEKVLEAPGDFWMGVAGPPGLPQPIVKRINMAMMKALDHPDMKQFFAKSGGAPAGGSPEALQTLWTAEQRRWQAVIRANNITTD